MRCLIAAILAIQLAVGRVLDASINSCSSKCKLICHECGQSNPRDVVKCLDRSLLRDCTAETVLTEAWNVTHYCLTTDSEVGGWGFVTPVVRDITPAYVRSATLTANLVATTGPYDVLQDSSADVKLIIMEDISTSPQESIMRSCAIETTSGTAGVLVAEASSIPRVCPDDSTPDPKLGCPYAAVPVTLQVDTSLVGSEAIKKSQAIIAVVGDMKTLANGGVLPPALDKALFTMEHTVVSSA